MSELYEKLLNEARAERRARSTTTRKAYTQDKLAQLEAAMPVLPIFGLAHVIARDWTTPYFGAVPYIDAMHSIESADDTYGADRAVDIVRYFLANAQTWRGPVARMVKKELRRRV